ncbi:MAG: hypothetical protein OXN89_20460 [Bryobacterales bacterium]|nr:hypothetical protein [Bryobacterales bacterium]
MHKPGQIFRYAYRLNGGNASESTLGKRHPHHRFGDIGIRRWDLTQARAILDLAARVHAGGIVGKGAEVAADAVIGEHSVIGPDSTVGKRVLMGAYLAVGRRVTVGSEADLQADVGLGEGSTIGARWNVGELRSGHRSRQGQHRLPAQSAQKRGGQQTRASAAVQLAFQCCRANSVGGHPLGEFRLAMLGPVCHRMRIR